MNEAQDNFFGTAYREAARAIVAWSFGLKVRGIDIRAEGTAARADIGDAGHLPLVDQIAVIVASHEAEGWRSAWPRFAISMRRALQASPRRRPERPGNGASINRCGSRPG